MTSCSDCPIPEGRACNAVYCGFFHSGNATKRQHVLNLAAGPEAPLHGSPSLGEQAANLAGAVVRFIASGSELASVEERARRAAICSACPELVDGRCSLCGCALQLKRRMLSEKCPVEKW